MFEEMCLEVSEIQHAWLEHWAIMDYYMTCKWMMETHIEPPDGPIKDTIRSFTTQMEVAKWYFIASMPVLLIGNYHGLLGGTMWLDKLVELRTVESCVELKRAGFDYPIICI